MVLLRSLHPPPPWLCRWSPDTHRGDVHLIVWRLSTVPVIKTDLSIGGSCLSPSDCWGSPWPPSWWFRATLNDDTRTDRPNTAAEVCVDGARGYISLEAHVRPRVPLWSFKSPVLVALEGTDHLALRPFRGAPSSRLPLTYRTSGSWAGWWFMRIRPNCCIQPGLNLNKAEWMEDIYKPHTTYIISFMTGGHSLWRMDGYYLSMCLLAAFDGIEES